MYYIMKQNERQFFRFLCKQIDYKNIKMMPHGYLQLPFIKPMGELITQFATKKNVAEKQLRYYLSKWFFYEDDFETFAISQHDQFPKEYQIIVPERTMWKIRQAIMLNKKPTKKVLK